MEKNTRTNTLEEDARAVDYENVKMNAEGVSIPVAVAKMIIEIICSPKLSHADSVPNRLGASFPLLEIGSICLQRSA